MPMRLYAYMPIWLYIRSLFKLLFRYIYITLGVAKNNNYYTTTTYVFVYRVFEHFSLTYFENYLQTPTSVCKWNRN